jgi:acyl dehydratase
MDESTPASPAPTKPPGTAAKAFRYYWEDFPAGHKSSFGAMPVTREAVLDFARQFDPQPFHLDEEAAQASLFGGLCASGWHTCAMAMRMMCDEYLLESASLGSPGLENLRWLKPVFPGDVLSMQHEVLDVRPMGSKPKVGLIRSAWEVRNQRGEAVMKMEGWSMFRRRHPEPASGTAPG